MKMKLVGLALLFVSGFAIAEQKLLCEYFGQTEVVYLRGDGQNTSWQWNEFMTVNESWSADTVVWTKTMELTKPEAPNEITTRTSAMYVINRYNGDMWIEYTSSSAEDNFRANGSCRPATEKLF